MCNHHHMEKNAHNKMCCSPAEVKCCCVEKEDFRERENEIRECVSSLRKKADYIEDKLSGK